MGVGFLFFNSAPIFFHFLVCGLAGAPIMQLHCFCYDVVYHCLLYHFWSCKLKCPPCQFYVLLLSTLPSIPTGSVPITSWASLAHFIPLASSACFIPWGILGPFHSFLPLTFLWAFAKFFGLPQPNYHILYFWVYWPLNQSHLLIPFFGLIQPVFSFFLFLMIPMGLPFLSLRLPWARLLSLGSFYYFVGL